ncbi:MAG: type IV pilin protein [Pseudomonadota bacterium]
MRSGGFTLVELMIAVAILAIVAAVAMPLYNQYSQRTYRSEAQADLMACAQGLERYAAQNFSYAGADTSFPDGICDPESEDQGRYDITVNIPNDNEFTLTASPVSGGVMEGTGDLTYNHAGERTWDGEDGWEE